MATVTITNAIREHVRAKIRDLFKGRKAEYERALHTLPLADETVEILLGAKTLSLVAQLNADPNRTLVFLHENVRLRLMIRRPDGTPREYAAYMKFHHGKKPLPAQWSSSFTTVPDTAPSYKTAEQLLNNLWDAEHEEHKLQEALSKVLHQCGTLRQVLEVWPTALEYMPEYVKQRHRQVTEKKAKKTIDTVASEAQALLIKAKMLI